MLLQQNETLAAKEKSKEEANRHLTELKEEQDTLNLKIKQLQDDEYIAKLLRKEYYLSEKVRLFSSFQIRKIKRRLKSYVLLTLFYCYI